MSRAFRFAAACVAGPAVMAAGDAKSQSAPSPQVNASMPAGFAELDQTRRLVVDTYFAGERIGQFEVRADAATLEYLQPEQVVAAVPDLADSAALQAALSGTLNANPRYVCPEEGTPCPRPEPDVAAVVYDAQRFRIDLYVNPRLLKIHAQASDLFLRPFSQALSVVDAVGVAVAGGDGQPLSYNVRNRLVASAGAGRLFSEASFSSGRGLEVDTLAAQLDHRDLRYSAGFFYLPGSDLVGRRRILGIGAATQFETRADRQAMTGTPLVVFLAQRSRVDLYVQDRLVSSYTFEGGNQRLDTSSLPDGSYPVDIRIQEAGGATRTERRFFTKSATLAPPGRTLWYANAGFVAQDHVHGGLAASKSALLAAGAAGRRGNHFAWDVAVMTANHTILSEVGASLLTTQVRGRVAVLGSTSGDRGIVAQIGTTGGGRFNYNLDMRRVRSGAGQSLLPVSDPTINAFSIADMGVQKLYAANKSYTQMIGNASYHVANAHLGISAYYRADSGGRSSYAIGPTLRWTIFERKNLQLTATANYAETDRGRTVAAGLQLQLLRQRSSFSSGLGVQTNGDGRRRSLDEVAEISGSLQRDRVLGGEFTGTASLQHSGRNNILQGAADLRGPTGMASISAVNRIGGDSAGRQFGMTAQTAIGFGHGKVRVGARDQNDGIITVSVDGSVEGARFEVLVDEVVRGTIRPGEHLTLAVMPYRRYNVSMRPIGAELVAFDTKSRTIDIFPGTFAPLEWQVTAVLAMFGRLVDSDGVPIANADITAGDAIAATDDRGYFQLQAPSDARLTVNRANGAPCSAKLNARRSSQGYTSLGDVICTS